LLIHRVEDVTAFVRLRLARPPGEVDVPYRAAAGRQTDLMVQSQALHTENVLLRQENLAEHEIAVALQNAMRPPAVPSLGSLGSLEVAARYRPAEATMLVCGDWYDVIDLGRGVVGIIVGDVVGHRLAAAAGCLRRCCVVVSTPTTLLWSSSVAASYRPCR
jgi:hypothetical protein